MSVKTVTVETRPIAGQVMGTSGLRKKVTEASQPHYLENFVEAILRAMESRGTDLRGTTWVCGGDGRYLNSRCLEVVIKALAARGVSKLIVGRGGMLSTPAASHLIRARKATAGLLMTASHNPGGLRGDFGLKLNMSNGGPAPKDVTDEVQRQADKVTSYVTAESLEEARRIVEEVDPCDEYVAMIREAFDVTAIREFIQKSKLRCVVDSLNAVTGVYTRRVFQDELGITVGEGASLLANAVPKEDFGGGHPDPNLTYAHELVERMRSGQYDFGAAFDGDGDRNMIMGKGGFFVTPSDSVAVLAANHAHIRYFREKGFRGVARSMPTSAALDRVAEKEKLKFAEVPTGWKFFGNLMDAGRLSVCGEESFGTGCDLIREKDGIWAAVAWLSVLAGVNKGRTKAPFLGIEDVVKVHWETFGRNYYCRYDYEEVDAEAANKLMQHLREFCKPGCMPQAKCRGAALVKVDDFEYHDPVDGSVTAQQGIRFIFADGTRAIFRLSGTGSVGATIRVYFDQYEPDRARLNLEASDALRELVSLVMGWAKIEQFTGRSRPSVIT